MNKMRIAVFILAGLSVLLSVATLISILSEAR